MTRLILHVFEVLKAHALLRWASLSGLTVALVLLLSGQSYKEDISDFLPLDDGQQQAFQAYQSTSGARRIYAIFQAADSSRQTAIDLFCKVMDSADSAQMIDYMTADDPAWMQETMNSIYAKMPYLLTKEDYARIDSLTAGQDYISQQLEHDRQLLMLPTAGVMTWQMQHDPLNLFWPVVERLSSSRNADQAMVLIDSPYGASETAHNAHLVAILQMGCDRVRHAYPDVDVRLTGGPVIAVGNAQQIKTDSMVSITVAIVLILFLLWLEFRNARNLLLIALSIGWGWLFAMGCLTLVDNEVSIIIIGISSVILGIAVNYPLHLVAHLSYTADVRTALREIAVPLVVGNLTTVGAFLALVPLESVALRDLGLFSACLLIGTILFVLLWLPHMVDQVPKTAPNMFGKIGDLNIEKKSWIVWTVVTLTFVLGYFSLQTSFDADLRNINYMTDEQRRDMQYLEQFSNDKTQESDLKQWNEWRKGKGAQLCRQLREESVRMGFSEDSFDDFYKIVSTEPSNDVQTLTAVIINNLTDNFNYIGWACGVIVFFFLWFSLGSIELALLSFIPMAVSWVWILGIMSMLGIQFNVVNIILATFIFGQGDDYTIFMTEGCQYEYAYRRKMLSSYKHSIIISALIMFIGIGALIFAQHPALYSLAEVTIIGMFSVVFMAWLFPPLFFRWLVYEHGKERYRPLSIKNMVRRGDGQTADLVADCYRYRGIEISASVNRRLRRYRSKGYLEWIDRQISPKTKTVVFINSGWGEIVMYYALQRPDTTFVAIEKAHDKQSVARHVAENRVANVCFVEDQSWAPVGAPGEPVASMTDRGLQAILLDPSDKDINDYSFLNPIII